MADADKIPTVLPKHVNSVLDRLREILALVRERRTSQLEEKIKTILTSLLRLIISLVLNFYCINNQPVLSS